MKDLQNHVSIVSLLDPVVVSATATITDIDLAGFGSAVLVLSFGLDAGTGLAAGVHQLDFVLYDSADGTTYAVVETDDMVDTTVTAGSIFTLDTTAKDNEIYQFGYVGGNRYLQLIYTETGTVSCPMAIWLVKGHPLDIPIL